jgi:CheY-like chemotaxis protein
MPAMDDKGKRVRQRVLCVDDSWDLLKLQKLILEGAGYAVLLASDGAESVNLVAKGCRIDLVVLSCEMTPMTGAEVAQRLREIEPELPVLMVSAVTLPQDSSKAERCVIPKTEMVMTLVGQIKRLLRRHAGRARPSVRPEDWKAN